MTPARIVQTYAMAYALRGSTDGAGIYGAPQSPRFVAQRDLIQVAALGRGSQAAGLAGVAQRWALGQNPRRQKVGRRDG